MACHAPTTAPTFTLLFCNTRDTAATKKGRATGASLFTLRLAANAH